MRTSIIKPTLINIIRTPLLRNVFLICLAAIIFLSTFNLFYVMPKALEQMLKNIESTAHRTASHLAAPFFENPGPITKERLTHEIINDIMIAKKDFRLEKIKIFTPTGEIIFSSDKSDIGKINENDYFHSIVAKGDIYSKIVTNKQKTLEGRVLDRDVAEVYVPVIHLKDFMGAFEIYYDISDRKQKMDKLLSNSSYIQYTIAISLFFFIIVMLFKVNKAITAKTEIEEKLQTSNEQLEGRVTAQTNEIAAIQQISVEALAILAEHYDSHTGKHLTRIQEYVVLLVSWLKNNSPYSEYIKSKPDYINDIKLASLLHDIGKTGIPQEILTKPARLTKEEFEEVKKHTLIAGEALDRANRSFIETFGKDSYLALARDIALYHHEKWNGTGYPYGLKEAAIPISARIVALADVYDALRSRRPYKEPFTHEFAEDEIRTEKGEHFDPFVVDAFFAQADIFERISSEHNFAEKE